LLSDYSYLLEGLQSADKTKMHPKAKLQYAPTLSAEYLCLAQSFRVNL